MFRKYRLIPSYLLFIILGPLGSACQQKLHNSKPGEVGVMHFRAYVTPKPDTFNITNAKKIVDTATYFVHDNFIFRKSYPAVPQRKTITDPNGSRKMVEFNIQTPEYVIDFNKEIYFTFNPDSGKVIHKSIRELKSDFLFFARTQKQTRLQLLSLDTNNALRVNGQTTYEGAALMANTGDTAVFRCIREAAVLKSPLNDWIPGTKFAVTAIAIPVGNPKDSSAGWLNFELYDLKAQVTSIQEFMTDVNDRDN